ncbi:MAG: hypothetical protein JWN86_757 [Planctomycetota bacterium]|nr:hypothetical protein [Planctomycetota bacterium]
MTSPHDCGGLAAARTETRRASRRARPELVGLEPRRLLSSVASVEPSADEQYMLQLVNRARANPPAEAQRLLSIARNDPTIKNALHNWDASAFLQEMNAHGPLPPLAFNLRLIAASREHNARMLAQNAQVHAPAGSLARPATPDQMAPDGQPYYPTGESSWAMAENVFAYSNNLPDAHGKALDDYFEEAFFLDWGNPDFGHLRNLLMPGPSGSAAAGTYPMTEIGIGLMTDAHPTTPPPSVAAMAGNQGLNVGPALVTQEFGWRSGHQFLTGAVSQDANNDGFYTPGEGLSGVRIEAIGRHAEGTYDAITWGSGGYTLDLPAGTYDVTATGAGLASPRTTAITIGTDNVGWDVVVSPPAAAPPVLVPPTQTPSSPTASQSQAKPSVKVASPNDTPRGWSYLTGKAHHKKRRHGVPHPKPPKLHKHR